MRCSLTAAPLLPFLPLLASLLAGAAGPSAAVAEPMDLSDPTPRWVEVQFGFAPAAPESPVAATRRFRARAEPGDADGTLQVTLPGEVVEEHLFGTQSPKRGSFSDFVWTLDRATGRATARLTGVLIRTVSMGFFDTELEPRIEVEMSSDARAGFTEPKELMGNTFSRFCDDPGATDCTIVDGARYDPESGTVRAVGALSATTTIVTTRTLAPHGEAVFREADSLSSVSAPPPAPIARD